MIFGIPNKEWCNFKKMFFYFLVGVKTLEILAYV